MKRDFLAVVYLSTVPAMMDEIDALFAVAEKNDSSAKSIAACVTVMLAAALDQGTLTVLGSASAQEMRRAGREVPGPGPCTLLYQESLRKRIVRLPEVMSRNRFRLKTESVHVTRLHDLVSARNELMHVLEDPFVEQIQLDLDSPQNINVEMPPIVNRWLMVRIEEARAYRTAVGYYVDEVLFPPKGQIKAGTVVKPVS